MNATDLLLAAYATAAAKNRDLQKKWISVSFALGKIAGNAHLMAVQRNGQLDLLLRLLESERLDRMKDGRPEGIDLSLDLQFALSENWLLSAYEVARAAKKPFEASGEDASPLLALERRLALVRMPVAKGVIQGMDRKPHKDNPPMMIREGESTPEQYRDDGSYMAPCRLCADTGAVLWLPADMATGGTAAICRRDLSDEMLALFD